MAWRGGLVFGSLGKKLRARLQGLALAGTRDVFEAHAREAVAYIAGQVQGTHFKVNGGAVDVSLSDERARLIDAFERAWGRGSKDIESWTLQAQELLDRAGQDGATVYDRAAALISSGMLKVELVCRAACLCPDDQRMQDLAFETLTLNMAAVDYIFSGKTTDEHLPGEEYPAVILLQDLPYADKVFDRGSESDEAHQTVASNFVATASDAAGRPGMLDRAKMVFAHLRMGVIGLGIAFGYFCAAAIVFWGVLGLGIAALLQLCFASLGEMPLFAAAGITVAPVLLVLSLLRAIFKQPKKAHVTRVVNYIAKLYPPRPTATEIQRRRYLSALPTAVKVALSGVYLASLVIMIGFAAAMTVGYGHVYAPTDLFNVTAGDDSARSIIQNFLFWLNVPFDLLLLDAPGTFGVRLTALQANGSAYGFLTVILLFRLLLVSAVINLVYLVVTTKFDPDSQVTFEQAMGVSPG
ncbi:MAG: hypothetical protein AAGC70_15450 [Pseudomonadota bacterium]